MRILAFSDIHTSERAIEALKKKILKYKPDLAINVGDFAIFDQGLEITLKKLDKLGIPMLTLYGNHETDTIVEYWCKKSKNLMYLHEDTKVIGGVTFMAWGGGGFSKVEPQFERWLKTVNMNKVNKPVVFLTHAPPFNTKLDKIMRGHHVGCDTSKKFITKHSDKIVLAISGHIHETFYQTDKVKEAILMNPGPTGTIIDINEKSAVSFKIER